MKGGYLFFNDLARNSPKRFELWKTWTNMDTTLENHPLTITFRLFPAYDSFTFLFGAFDNCANLST